MSRAVGKIPGHDQNFGFVGYVRILFCHFMACMLCNNWKESGHRWWLAAGEDFTVFTEIRGDFPLSDARFLTPTQRTSGTVWWSPRISANWLPTGTRNTMWHSSRRQCYHQSESHSHRCSKPLHSIKVPKARSLSKRSLKPPTEVPTDRGPYRTPSGKLEMTHDVAIAVMHSAEESRRYTRSSICCLVAVSRNISSTLSLRSAACRNG